jgi:hypothetical protein
VSLNINEYFEIKSTADRVIHFELRGFWSDEVIAAIEDEFLQQFQEVVLAYDGQSFLVLADLTKFRTPSQQAQELVAKGIKFARENNLLKTIQVMPSALVQMAIRQSAKQTGRDDFRIVVTSVEEGWQKIEVLRRML